jgi:hypothetical protein
LQSYSPTIFHGVGLKNHLPVLFALFSLPAWAQLPSISSVEAGAMSEHNQEEDSLAKEDSLRIRAETASGKGADSAEPKGGIRATAKANKQTYVIGVYDPTYFSFAFPSGYELPDTNINRVDPPHFEFLVSPFLSVKLFPESIDTLKFLAIYRGLYNFYFGSEASGPVVSRMQNIDFFFEWYVKHWHPLKLMQFQLGAGHESNGMFVDSRAQYSEMMRAVPHRPDGSLPMNPQDFASMGWNYWKLTAARSFKLKNGNGVVSVSGGLKYFINQDFSSLVTLGHSKIEDTSFFFQLTEEPGISRFAGLNLGVSYFKSFRDKAPITYAVKSVYCTWSSRMGYDAPYNYSGNVLLSGDVTLLKMIYAGVTGIPYLGWVFCIFNGFNASLPVFLKWDYGYSENFAYYPVKYATPGKFSLGVILIGALHDSQ